MIPRFTCIVALVALVGVAAAGEHDYRLHRIYRVDGRQGVALGGESIYVSGSKALYRYDGEGNRTAENTAPFEGWHPTANHLGDIAYFGGEIYAGVEEFRDGRGYDLTIAVYDAETLAYKRSSPCDATSGQIEISGIGIDPRRGIAWMTDWTNGRDLYRYELASGRYLGKTRLFPVPQWQQGIAWHEGFLYVTADDGDADLHLPDHLYRLSGDPMQPAAEVRLEKAFTEVTRAGEIEGLAFNESGMLAILHNRGARIIEGMPVGFYPEYDKEISEVYLYVRGSSR